MEQKQINKEKNCVTSRLIKCYQFNLYKILKKININDRIRIILEKKNLLKSTKISPEKYLEYFVEMTINVT